MINDHSQPISITLSPTQIDDVVRAATDSRAPSVANLIADSLRIAAISDERMARASDDELADVRAPDGYQSIDNADPRLSRSLLRGLSILTRFGPDGGSRGIVELAGELGMSPSTAHRYAFTLVELGLLERCPKTRKYRLPGT